MDKGIYKSTDVARYIIAYGNELEVDMNITKVQKLLFIIYGAYLAKEDKRLTDEHPQAWPYGPVFPATRNNLLKFGFPQEKTTGTEFYNLKKDVSLNALINIVFEKFKNYNASQLIEWTHQPNSPWTNATKVDGFNWGDKIEDQSISAYFKKEFNY